MLIQLHGIPHPDLNGGVAQPVYIDATRVLLICQSHIALQKIGSIERRRELYDKLYIGATTLSEKLNGYVPDMTDPTAVGWMKTVQNASADVTQAYKLWGTSYNAAEDDHPRVDCTEIQLACGTALEHGVMLTRVWVSESVERAAALVQQGRA